jgi:hypothetical protein
MRITPSQLRAFQARAEEGFVARLIAYLHRCHAGLVAGIAPDEVRDRVRKAIERGRCHGLTWESTLSWFVVMTFELGPHFDEHPVFAAALRFQHPDERARIQFLRESVTWQDWNEAKREKER